MLNVNRFIVLSRLFLPSTTPLVEQLRKKIRDEKTRRFRRGSIGMASKREVPVSLQKRGRIIRLYTQKGIRKIDIKKEMRVSMTTILRWLSRWESKEGDRKVWYSRYKEGEVNIKEYRELLFSVLKDKPRPGTPKKFTDSEIEKIMSLAVIDPESLGLPFSRWSEALLKVELINRKIVESISMAQIGRFLKRT